MSPLAPLSPEERREADKIRRARLEKRNRAHVAGLRRQDLADLRRLEGSTKRDWTDECWLHFLRNKYGSEIQVMTGIGINQESPAPVEPGTPAATSCDEHIPRPQMTCDNRSHLVQPTSLANLSTRGKAIDRLGRLWSGEGEIFNLMNPNDISPNY